MPAGKPSQRTLAMLFIDPSVIWRVAGGSRAMGSAVYADVYALQERTKGLPHLSDTFVLCMLGLCV